MVTKKGKSGAGGGPRAPEVDGVKGTGGKVVRFSLPMESNPKPQGTAAAETRVSAALPGDVQGHGVSLPGDVQGLGVPLSEPVGKPLPRGDAGNHVVKAAGMACGDAAARVTVGDGRLDAATATGPGAASGAWGTLSLVGGGARTQGEPTGCVVGVPGHRSVVGVPDRVPSVTVKAAGSEGMVSGDLGGPLGSDRGTLAAAALVVDSGPLAPIRAVECGVSDGLVDHEERVVEDGDVLSDGHDEQVHEDQVKQAEALVAKVDAKQQGVYGVGAWGAGTKKLFMNSGLGGRLEFVTPTDDCVNIRVAEGIPMRTVWGWSLLGQYVGYQPSHFMLVDLMRSWGVRARYRVEEGWMIFQFDKEEDMEGVLRGGPYFIYGKPLILKHIPDKFAFSRRDIATIPLWVRVLGLPKNFWTAEILSRVLSHVGKPLFMDSVTDSRKRGAYARVLVEVDFSKEVKRNVALKFDDGVSIECKFLVENEPMYCTHCCAFGHVGESCEFLKKKAEVGANTKKVSAGVGGNTKGGGERKKNDKVKGKGLEVPKKGAGEVEKIYKKKEGEKGETLGGKNPSSKVIVGVGSVGMAPLLDLQSSPSLNVSNDHEEDELMSSSEDDEVAENEDDGSNNGVEEDVMETPPNENENVLEEGELGDNSCSESSKEEEELPFQVVVSGSQKKKARARAKAEKIEYYNQVIVGLKANKRWPQGESTRTLTRNRGHKQVVSQ